MILLERWRVRVRHAGSILPVVVGFEISRRSGSKVNKVASEAPPLTAEVDGSACSAVLAGSGWDRSAG